MFIGFSDIAFRLKNKQTLSHKIYDAFFKRIVIWPLFSAIRGRLEEGLWCGNLDTNIMPEGNLVNLLSWSNYNLYDLFCIVWYCKALVCWYHYRRVLTWKPQWIDRKTNRLLTFMKTVLTVQKKMAVLLWFYDCIQCMLQNLDTL